MIKKMLNISLAIGVTMIFLAPESDNTKLLISYYLIAVILVAAGLLLESEE